MSKHRISKHKPTRKGRASVPKLKRSRIMDIPTYAQSEEFTSSAACAMMVLKYTKANFKMRKEEEFKIWQEAVNGSVWHGSKYGLAYALAKRGARVNIVSSNVADEGYEKKLAVQNDINLDVLRASFNEIRGLARDLKVKEEHGGVTVNTLKRFISSGKIPIVLVDASKINPYLDSYPHWVVVKGYDDDTFYINDPYSDSTIAMEPDVLKGALGYENEYHVLLVGARR